MSDLSAGFAESVREGKIAPTLDAWTAFQLGALYATLFIAETLQASEGRSDRDRLLAVVSAIQCIDLETDMAPYPREAFA